MSIKKAIHKPKSSKKGKKKETKESGRKWDGHSRPVTDLYRKNYDEIFNNNTTKSNRT